MKKSFIVLSFSLLLTFFSFAQTLNWSNACHPGQRETYGVAFSLDGEKIISGSECHESHIRLWDAQTGNMLWDYQTDTSLMCLMGVKMSTNGQLLGVVEEMGNLLIFNYSDSVPVLQRTIPVNSGASFSVAFSPDNAKVATDGYDGSVRIFQISDGALLRTIDAHNKPVLTMDYSPNGNWIVTGSYDSTVKVWNANTGALISNLGKIGGRVTGVRFAADNSHLVACTNNGVIKVWMNHMNGSMWMLHNTISAPEGLYQVDFSDDIEFVLAGGATFAYVYDSMGDSLYAAFNVDGGNTVYTVDFKPGSYDCVIGTSNGKVAYWNLDAALTSIAPPALATIVRVSPNPATDAIHLTSSMLQATPAAYTLTDVRGVTVGTGTLTNAVSETIDVSALAAGTYHLRVVQGTVVCVAAFVK